MPSKTLLVNVNGSNAEAKLSELKERVERAKTARIQAEERKAAAERRLQELEAQIRELGVDPENVEEEIARLDREINTKIERIEELLAPFEEMTGNARSARTA